MDWQNRIRRSTAAASFLAGTVLLLSVPALASAEFVGDLLNSIGGNGQSDGGGFAQQSSQPSSFQPAVDSRSGVPPTYNPPLHGTNPHGQGTVAAVDLAPAGVDPVSGDPAGPETIVVGRPKGEQNPDGSYHGHITIAALLGNELLGVDTNEGQSGSSALDPLNDAVLGQICTASGGQLCLGILDAQSNTTADGSTNSFTIASAQLGGAPAGIGVTAGEAHGDISDNGTCQTSTGSANTASANVAALLTAGVSGDSSSSTACNDGTAPSTTNSSSVVNLNGTGVPVPATGCDTGVPDTSFVALSPLLSTVCNADDPGTGGQASSPYGVREALTVFLLPVLPGPVAKVTDAAESHSVAPTKAATPPGGNPYGSGNPLIAPGGGNGPGNGGNNNDNDNGENTAESAQAGSGNLAFTGVNLIWVAMLGLGLITAGLAIAGTASAVRRPRLDG
jgi:hypothetical protein